MVILAHRGLWNGSLDQKNTLQAITNSFNAGLGIETDIRDFMAEVVIAHDIPQHFSLSLNSVFKIYTSQNIKLPLALNIKSDGLQTKLKELIDKYQIKNYFFFDMSAPEYLGYLKFGLNFFTRQSEYEQNPIFYKESAGVWLDEFHTHWINNHVIEGHLGNKKKVCIVSPELHGREYINEWEEYREIAKKNNNTSDIMLCTDYPIEAIKFFNG